MRDMVFTQNEALISLVAGSYPLVRGISVYAEIPICNAWHGESVLCMIHLWDGGIHNTGVREVAHEFT